jgi:hypothetical protein
VSIIVARVGLKFSHFIHMQYINCVNYSVTCGILILDQVWVGLGSINDKKMLEPSHEPGVRGYELQCIIVISFTVH